MRNVRISRQISANLPLLFQRNHRGEASFASSTVKNINRMDTKKTRFLVLLLLLFFVGLAVSPVSAFVPSEPGVSKHDNTIKKDNTQSDIFIIDLILWEVLEKGRPSDYSSSLHSLLIEENAAKNIVTSLLEKTAEDLICHVIFLKTSRPFLIDCLSANLATRSTCSGVSPPFQS